MKLKAQEYCKLQMDVHITPNLVSYSNCSNNNNNNFYDDEDAPDVSISGVINDNNNNDNNNDNDNDNNDNGNINSNSNDKNFETNLNQYNNDKFNDNDIELDSINDHDLNSNDCNYSANKKNENGNDNIVTNYKKNNSSEIGVDIEKESKNESKRSKLEKTENDCKKWKANSNSSSSSNLNSTLTAKLDSDGVNENENRNNIYAGRPPKKTSMDDDFEVLMQLTAMLDGKRMGIQTVQDNVNKCSYKNPIGHEKKVATSSSITNCDTIIPDNSNSNPKNNNNDSSIVPIGTMTTFNGENGENGAIKNINVCKDRNMEMRKDDLLKDGQSDKDMILLSPHQECFDTNNKDNCKLDNENINNNNNKEKLAQKRTEKAWTNESKERKQRNINENEMEDIDMNLNINQDYGRSSNKSGGYYYCDECKVSLETVQDVDEHVRRIHCNTQETQETQKLDKKQSSMNNDITGKNINQSDVSNMNQLQETDGTNLNENIDKNLDKNNKDILGIPKSIITATSAATVQDVNVGIKDQKICQQESRQMQQQLFLHHSNNIRESNEPLIQPTAAAAMATKSKTKTKTKIKTNSNYPFAIGSSEQVNDQCNTNNIDTNHIDSLESSMNDHDDFMGHSINIKSENNCSRTAATRATAARKSKYEQDGEVFESVNLGPGWSIAGSSMDKKTLNQSAANAIMTNNSAFAKMLDLYGSTDSDDDEATRRMKREYRNPKPFYIDNKTPLLGNYNNKFNINNAVTTQQTRKDMINLKKHHQPARHGLGNSNYELKGEFNVNNISKIQTLGDPNGNLGNLSIPIAHRYPVLSQSGPIVGNSTGQDGRRPDNRERRHVNARNDGNIVNGDRYTGIDYSQIPPAIENIDNRYNNNNNNNNVMNKSDETIKIKRERADQFLKQKTRLQKRNVHVVSNNNSSGLVSQVSRQVSNDKHNNDNSSNTHHNVDATNLSTIAQVPIRTTNSNCANESGRSSRVGRSNRSSRGQTPRYNYNYQAQTAQKQKQKQKQRQNTQANLALVQGAQIGKIQGEKQIAARRLGYSSTVYANIGNENQYENQDEDFDETQSQIINYGPIGPRETGIGRSNSSSILTTATGTNDGHRQPMVFRTANARIITQLQPDAQIHEAAVAGTGMKLEPIRESGDHEMGSISNGQLQYNDSLPVIASIKPEPYCSGGNNSNNSGISNINTNNNNNGINIMPLTKLEAIRNRHGEFVMNTTNNLIKRTCDVPTGTTGSTTPNVPFSISPLSSNLQASKQSEKSQEKLDQKQGQGQAPAYQIPLVLGAPPLPQINFASFANTSTTPVTQISDINNNNVKENCKEKENENTNENENGRMKNPNNQSIDTDKKLDRKSNNKRCDEVIDLCDTPDEHINHVSIKNNKNGKIQNDRQQVTVSHAVSDIPPAVGSITADLTRNATEHVFVFPKFSTGNSVSNQRSNQNSNSNINDSDYGLSSKNDLFEHSLNTILNDRVSGVNINVRQQSIDDVDYTNQSTTLWASHNNDNDNSNSSNKSNSNGQIDLTNSDDGNNNSINDDEYDEYDDFTSVNIDIRSYNKSRFKIEKDETSSNPNSNSSNENWDENFNSKRRSRSRSKRKNKSKHRHRHRSKGRSRNRDRDRNRNRYRRSGHSRLKSKSKSKSKQRENKSKHENPNKNPNSRHKIKNNHSHSNINIPLSEDDRSISSFNSSFSLATNKIKIEENSKVIYCDSCDIIFDIYTPPERLCEHVETRHLSYKWQCFQCKKCYQSKSYLKSHYKTHTGEKPYPCDFCGARFRQKIHLKEHKRIHSNEKPYICHDCGKRFRAAGNLSKHVKSHNAHVTADDYPYHCKYCNRNFAREHQLRSHMRLNHAIMERMH